MCIHPPGAVHELPSRTGSAGILPLFVDSILCLSTTRMQHRSANVLNSPTRAQLDPPRPRYSGTRQTTIPDDDQLNQHNPFHHEPVRNSTHRPTKPTPAAAHPPLATPIHRNSCYNLPRFSSRTEQRWCWWALAPARIQVDAGRNAPVSG